jgi:hypothetical protein
MNDHAVTEDAFLEDSWVSPRERFLGRFAWVVLAGLGFLVFDLTAHPSLGVATFCLKFGLDRLKTAFWLVRKDPMRRRRFVLFLFYLARSISRIIMSAFLFIIGSAIVVNVFRQAQPNNGQARNPLFEEMKFAGYVVLIGYGIWLCVELIATFSALSLSVKVWVGSIADDSRRIDVWPPRYRMMNVPSIKDSVSLKKSLESQITLCMITFFITPIFTSIPGSIETVVNFSLDKNKTIFLIILVVMLYLALIVLLSVLHIRLLNKIIAKDPSECWPETKEVCFDG